MQDRIKTFVERGQLGPFANAYWGHPAYRLPPEANLMAVAHYLEALDWQREFIKMHAVLGGKNPHLQSFLVGGMATPVDPDSQASINMHTIAQLEVVHRVGARVRVDRSTSRICSRSPRSTRTGPATAAASATISSSATTPKTARRNRRCSFRRASSAAATSRRSSRSTRPRSPSTSRTPGTEYAQGDDAPLHPLKGETSPNYTGPNPPFKQLDTDKKYSWLKSPRYADEPMEVGPLARMLVSYVSGPPAGRSRWSMRC